MEISAQISKIFDKHSIIKGAMLSKKSEANDLGAIQPINNRVSILLVREKDVTSGILAVKMTNS